MAGKVEKLFKDFGWTGFGIAFALAVDYLFYLAAGRLLGPVEFGVFGVIMSIYYIAVRSPFSIIELTARKIQTDKKNVFKHLGRPTVYLGIIAFVVFILISPLLTEILDIPLLPFLIFCLIFPITYFTSVGTGSLQGSERFKEYAVFEMLTSLFKFSTIILIILGLGLSGAVTAPVMEMLAGLIVVYYYLRPKSLSTSFQYKEVLLNSAIVVFAINFAFNADLLLLKLFQSSEVVGLYYSIAVIGKAIIFGSAAVNKAVFPKFDGGKEDFKLLMISLGLIGLGGIFAASAFEVVGSIFMEITFGPEYTGAAAFAPVYMIFISLVAGCAAIGNYYLSVEREKLKYLLLLPIIQVGLILIFHQNVLEVIYSGIAASLITLVVMLKPLVSEKVQSRI